MKKNRAYWVSVSILLLVFAGAVFLSFFVFFRSNAARVEKTNLYYLEQDSGRLAQQMDTMFHDSKNYLKNIGAIFSESSISDLAEMRKLLETLAEDAPFDNLYFAYADGTGYRYTGEKMDVSDRDYFHRALQGESGVTEPFISKMTGKEVIIFYHPVEREGQVRAVLLGVYYLSEVEKRLKTTFMEQGVYSAIIAQDGRILVGSSSEQNGRNLMEEIRRFGILGDRTIEDMQEDLEARRTGIIYYQGLKDMSLVMYRPLKNTAWYIVQNLPSQILNNMKMASNVAGMYLAAVLSVGFVALYLVIFLLMRRRSRELYMENQRIRAIMDSSCSLIIEYDLVHGQTMWYGDAEHLFCDGKSCQDFLDMVCVDDLEKIKKQIADVEAGNNHAIEIRLRKRTGDYLWCNCQMVGVCLPSGKVVRIIAIIRDIDEVKRRAMALENERDLLAESIKMMGDTYFKIMIMRLEDGRCRFIRMPEDELGVATDYVGRYYEIAVNMLHPDDKEQFLEELSLEALKRDLCAENPMRSLIYRRRRGQTDEYMWVQAEYILCENGREIMIYVKDVTDEQIREEQHKKEIQQSLDEAKEANRIKTNFLEYISHDLQTPMNAVIGMNELTLHAIEEGDQVRAKNYAQSVHLSAGYLMSLISDILEMSRFHKNGIVLMHEPFRWEKVMESCRDYFSYLASNAKITLMIDSQVSGEYVGDFMRMSQLLFNLIENAVKFNKPDGTVSLTAVYAHSEEDREWIRITVADTGIGMDEGVKKKLFEPFSRGVLITSEVHSGTGIGLSIVKHIVDAMGGEIHVESVLDQGTTFELLLPVVKAKHTALQMKRAGKERLTVLVVDDIEINLEIAATLLQEEGFDTLTATGASEALTTFAQSKEGTIDIVLTDISMPEMDGFAFAKALRAMDRADAKEVFIIALSAYGFAESRERFEASGMNAFMNKPFDVSQFKDIVEA